MGGQQHIGGGRQGAKGPEVVTGGPPRGTERKIERVDVGQQVS